MKTFSEVKDNEWFEVDCTGRWSLFQRRVEGIFKSRSGDKRKYNAYCPATDHYVFFYDFAECKQVNE